MSPPSVTISTHTSASNADAFQSPAMSNVRMALCTQSVHSKIVQQSVFDISNELLNERWNKQSLVSPTARTTTVSC